MPFGGNIGFLTKSFALEKESSEEAVIEKDRKYIEVLMTFTSYKKPMEKSMEELNTPTSQEEIASDLLLKLVDVIVKMNQGITRFEVDKTKMKTFIFLKFPVERRKVVFYGPINTHCSLNKHNIY